MNENKKKEKIPTRKQLVKAYEYADEIEAMIHLNTIENKTKNLLWLKTYYKKIQMIGKIIAQCHNSIYFQECKKLLEERKKKKELE